MHDRHFSVSLAVLRVIRGWSQEELARQSGVRPSSISDYERGKIVPGATTLQRLLDAMGYPFAALDHTHDLIASLRAASELRAAARVETAAGGLSAPTNSDSPARDEGSGLQRWEVEQAAIEAGKVAARLTRLFFTLVEPRRGTGAPGAGSETDRSDP